MMPRSHSDAALCALNQRLGGLARSAGGSSSHSSNLGSCASSLLGGSLPSRLMVEGSLGSVTASSRGQVQSPAALSRKKVQGLADLHDTGRGIKPLKAMFKPPREVRRWPEACASCWPRAHH